MCVSGALFLSSLEIRELQTRVFLAHGIPAFKNAVSTVMALKSTGSIAAVAAKCSLEIGIPVAVARAVKYITHIHAAISVEDGSSAQPLLEMLRWRRWRSWWWTAPASLERPLPAKVIVTVVPCSDVST